MAFVVGQSYPATVTEAYVTKFDTGTWALQINYNTAEGPAGRAWPISPATVERLVENLGKCFGLTRQQLEDMDFLTNKLGPFMIGKKCSIVMKDNEYKNKAGVTVKNLEVQWMNAVNLQPVSRPEDVKTVCNLFGGRTSLSGGSGMDDPPPTDWGPEGDPGAF